MFSVNKNIIHNGAIYSSGQEIKESAPGFKELLKAGHVDGGAIVAGSGDSGEVVLDPGVSDSNLDAEAEEAPKKKKGK